MIPEDRQQKVIDFWNRTYSYTIPIFVSVFFFTGSKVTESSFDLTTSDNFTGMLEGIITFISIAISIFGFLLPVLVSAKEEGAVKTFLEIANRRVFLKGLKRIILSGFIAIFLSCVLYLYDIFSEDVVRVIESIWLGSLFFFMATTYRFVSIMLSLLFSGYRKKKNLFSEEDEQKRIKTMEKLSQAEEKKHK